MCPDCRFNRGAPDENRSCPVCLAWRTDLCLEPGVAGAALSALGRRARRSQCWSVSPHWITSGFRVTSGTRPATIHDFSGFPPALYELQYPAPGDPARAAEIVRLLASAGIDVTLDAQRGLDHGAWVPLRHLLPDASTPVLQLSLSDSLDARGPCGSERRCVRCASMACWWSARAA